MPLRTPRIGLSLRLIRIIYFSLLFFLSFFSFSCSLKKRIQLYEKPEEILYKLYPNIETFRARERIQYFDRSSRTIFEQNIFYSRSDGFLAETRDFFGRVISSLLIVNDHFYLLDYKTGRTIHGGKEPAWIKKLFGININIELLESILFHGRPDRKFDSIKIAENEVALLFFLREKLVSKISFNPRSGIINSIFNFDENKKITEKISLKRYKRINGISFPTTLVYSNIIDGIKCTIKFQNIKINEEIPKRIFDLQKFLNFEKV